jgi:hypothetical protein
MKAFRIQIRRRQSVVNLGALALMAGWRCQLEQSVAAHIGSVTDTNIVAQIRARLAL